MDKDELDRNLWQAIDQFRQMYGWKTAESKAWDALLNLPPKDTIFDHDLLIGEERNHFGVFLVLVDNTAHEVKRWRLKEETE